MPALREEVLEIVLEHGYRRLSTPVTLASGEQSYDYVDVKKALARGPHLRIACEAMLSLARSAGHTFDAVGGLTMGADQFAYGMALASGCSWFVARKQTKDHGTKRRIEGADLDPEVSVLLVEDVVTTGGSMIDALQVVRATGARVVLATALVDRGDLAGGRLSQEGVPYRALLTYADLGIDPVAGGPAAGSDGRG